MRLARDVWQNVPPMNGLFIIAAIAVAAVGYAVGLTLWRQYEIAQARRRARQARESAAQPSVEARPPAAPPSFEARPPLVDAPPGS